MLNFLIRKSLRFLNHLHREIHIECERLIEADYRRHFPNPLDIKETDATIARMRRFYRKALGAYIPVLVGAFSLIVSVLALSVSVYAANKEIPLSEEHSHVNASIVNIQPPVCFNSVLGLGCYTPGQLTEELN